MPTEVQGEATLTGNININNALKALEDVNLYGEVKNTNNSVIFSKYGDIVIDSQNVNLNGLVYAPFGSVTINAQNLNLNNVVIIAESIELTCPNVNANNSSNVSSFVGSTSEPLDIHYDEWQYMKDENGNDFPDFFENLDNWGLLKDTDGDQLPNCVEQFIGTDTNLVDTDGDMLDDYYEIFITNTDPKLPDTDSNGISDGDEDFDADALTNYQEYVLGTSPFDADSDGDELSDGDEVNTYSTNPLELDTDFDGLSDADEFVLGTDPNLPDTDGDGTLDGEERFAQTFVYDVESEDCAIEQVIVSMEGTGNLQSNTSVESVMNIDMLSTNVAGLIGEPFEISTTSEFDQATLSFVVDKSKLGETQFDDLLFLWYDEENNNYVELDTIRDEENCIVSIETTHFSRYMIVDQEKWFDAWSVEFNYRPSDSGSSFRVAYDTVIAIDCSGSMYSYDTTGTNSNRAKAVENFLETMRDGDRAAIITFSGSINSYSALTEETDDLKQILSSINSSGGTSFYSALSTALTLFDSNDSKPINKRIILLSDGEDTIPYSVLDECNSRHIPVYTIGLGSSSNSILTNIANYTGGTHFYAYTSEQLLDIYSEIGFEADFDTTDTDGDGLYDAVEAAGIRLQNGDIIYDCDPNDRDSDDDYLNDGEEINPTPKYSKKEKYNKDGSIKTVKGYYFEIESDPLNPDSDYDYYLDGKDSAPYTWKRSKVYDEDIDDSNSATGSNPSLNTDNNSNGTLKRIIMGEGGTQYKNEYVFERSNNVNYIHKGYASQFSLRPERESFYSITVTNVNSIDDVDIKVTYVNEKFLLKDKTIKVNQYSDATYDSNYHSATFYYLLEPDNDTAYTICINNNTSCDTYEVRVSQDNWVFAEYGAVCKAHEEATWFDSLDYQSIYISDKGLYQIINNYCVARFNDPSISYEQFINRTDTGIKDDTNPFYYTCIRNVGYLNAAQTYGDAMADTVNSIIGNGASISGVFLLVPISTAASAVVTVVGGISAGFSIQSALFDAQVDEKRQEFIDAMYDGKFNFYIYNLSVETTFLEYNYSEYKSFHPWDSNNYVNKINLNTVYNVTPLTFTTLHEMEDGTWRVIP